MCLFKKSIPHLPSIHALREIPTFLYRKKCPANTGVILFAGPCCEAPTIYTAVSAGEARQRVPTPGRIDGKSRSDEDQTDKKQVADQAHRQQTQPGNRHQVMGQAKGNEYRKDEGSDIYDKEISAADRRIDIEKHNDEDNPCNKSYGLCGDKVFHKLTVVDILVEGP